MTVCPVTLLNVTQDFLEGARCAALYQLLHAAPGTNLCRRGEKNFHIRIGQHHCADVAAVHNHIVALGHIALHIQQESAHGRDGRHIRSVHGDLGQADLIRHILAAQHHMLQAVVAIAHIHLDVRQRCGNSLGILGIDIVFPDIVPDGAIDRAGIYIDNPHFCRDGFGQCTFSRAGRAVNCYGILLFNHFLTSIFCSRPTRLSPCGPGNLQIKSAGIGIHIQHFTGKV